MKYDPTGLTDEQKIQREKSKNMDLWNNNTGRDERELSEHNKVAAFAILAGASVALNWFVSQIGGIRACRP